MKLKLSQFDYNLPQNLIAQKPASPPDTCRLLVVNKKTEKIKDDNFFYLTAHLKKGDVLVFNNSKVLPARLIGTKPTGGKAEILLLKQINSSTWEALTGNIKQHHKLNLKISLAKNFFGTIIKVNPTTSIIKFNLSGPKLMAQIFKHGQMPTPPYIKRLVPQKEYQTIYAKKLGSVAAPTAGLHFTKRMFAKLKKLGVQTEFVTLHVGLGTFASVKEQDITKHQIHSEYFELDKKTAQRLNKAKNEGRRIIAIGTTTVRVIETVAKSPPARGGETEGEGAQFVIRNSMGDTSIFIYPGYKFKFVDAMITNFHLPKSTLLMLISAFANIKLIKKAYSHAIKKKYHFYSLGDAMLII